LWSPRIRRILASNRVFEVAAVLDSFCAGFRGYGQSVGGADRARRRFRVNVLRVGFVGTRTGDVEATTSFFSDVLGLDVVKDEPQWSIFQLPTSRFDFVEIYGSSFDDKRLAPADVSSFIGFVVDDVVSAHAEVTAAGHEATDVVWASEAFDNPSFQEYGWFFVSAPDGNVYGIQQAPE
jgi:catechol 2,3-dioxygenase-like lactoylglutathione lyase family enzyme